MSAVHLFRSGARSGVALALMAIAPVEAGELPAPKGEVILVVTGAIANTNGPGAARFDLALLESLPQHGFDTSTIWTEGVHAYSGVLLRDLLQAVGAQGGEVRLWALNDYGASLPPSEVGDEAPLLAYRVDGQLIPVREKGPVWLIYPYDDHPDFRTEAIYSRSVWQLRKIEVLD